MATQIVVVALKKLLRDVYGDDVATCFYTMKEGLEFYCELKKCFKKGVSELKELNKGQNLCWREWKYEQNKNLLGA